MLIKYTQDYMRLLLSLFIICMAVSATAQTQYEMNMEAAAEYQKADKELNKVYEEIIKRNTADTAFIRNLKISQRLWVQFRDAELKMKYPEREKGYYGSTQPLCEYEYLEELTKERITRLKQWLEGNEEGDSCGGTLPIKE